MKRTRMTERFILGTLLLGAGLAGKAGAAEALFGAADDNLLLNDTVGWSRHNWGVFPQLAVGLNAANQPYRSLLRFDLSGLGAENLDHLGHADTGDGSGCQADSNERQLRIAALAAG